MSDAPTLTLRMVNKDDYAVIHLHRDDRGRLDGYLLVAAVALLLDEATLAVVGAVTVRGREAGLAIVDPEGVVHFDGQMWPGPESFYAWAVKHAH